MTRDAIVKLLWRGVDHGWWEDVDEDALLPVKKFSRAEFHDHATWGHVWMKLHRFHSMKEAKRAGWGIPLTCERKRLGTYIVEITHTFFIPPGDGCPGIHLSHCFWCDAPNPEFDKPPEAP